MASVENFVQQAGKFWENLHSSGQGSRRPSLVSEASYAGETLIGFGMAEIV